MTNPQVAVVDYGVGNIFNVVKALNRLNADVRLTNDVSELEKSDALILPGVGTFEAGIEGLKRHRLFDPIREISASGKPILGICLGAQLLLSEGHEFGVFQGLDIIPGTVEHFSAELVHAKIPHIGWNAIREPHAGVWDESILSHVPASSNVYFIHSYYLRPKSDEHVLATTVYGDFTFCSAVRKGNTFGTQFHPEKSGETGLAILNDFLKLI